MKAPVLIAVAVGLALGCVAGIMLGGAAASDCRPAKASAWLGYLLRKGGTEFSSRFSERAFEEVETPLPGSAVITLLGEPLRRDSVASGNPLRALGATEIWHFSTRRPNASHYVIRTITVNQDGVALQKYCSAE